MPGLGLVLAGLSVVSSSEPGWMVDCFHAGWLTASIRPGSLSSRKAVGMKYVYGIRDSDTGQFIVLGNSDSIQDIPAIEIYQRLDFATGDEYRLDNVVNIGNQPNRRSSPASDNPSGHRDAPVLHIRKWALEHGYKIGSRGRIPDRVTVAYRAYQKAHEPIGW